MEHCCAWANGLAGAFQCCDRINSGSMVVVMGPLSTRHDLRLYWFDRSLTTSFGLGLRSNRNSEATFGGTPGTLMRRCSRSNCTVSSFSSACTLEEDIKGVFSPLAGILHSPVPNFWFLFGLIGHAWAGTPLCLEIWAGSWSELPITVFASVNPLQTKYCHHVLGFKYLWH